MINMKATGIVRRIDDLGRIVIPKEIRRSLRIREGDPLEIYTIEGGVCFKPYTTWEQNAKDFASALIGEMACPLAIYDRQGFVVYGRADVFSPSLDEVEMGLAPAIRVEGETMGYVFPEHAWSPEQLAEAKKCARILSAYLR